MTPDDHTDRPPLATHRSGPATAAVDGTDPPGSPPEQSIGEAVAAQIGGWSGLVESAVPVAVFIVANMVTTLTPAIWAAVVAAVLIAVFRLVRRESVRHAVNGLIGVAIAAMFAARTGTEEGFYLPGIVLSYGYGVVILASALIGRPLVGYAWSAVTGSVRDWRSRPRLLRAFALGTVVLAAPFFVNSSVQLALYFAQMPTALGIARLAGKILYVVAVLFVVWYGRRAVAAERHVDAQGSAAATSEHTTPG